MTRRSALVTGGASGLGSAAAERLRADGLAVTTLDLRGADVTADVTDEAALQRVAAEVGPVDVLVNSAGAARRVGAEDLTPEAWRAAMDAKYFSYIHVIDPLIKKMAARGRGAIVNVIGSGGKVATATHISGGAANAALMLATAGLANAYAGKGVRVIGINPGPTKTERVGASLKADAQRDGITEDEALKRIVQKMPMKRMPEPHEIADLIVFAASERAKFLTGAILSADAATNPTVV